MNVLWLYRYFGSKARISKAMKWKKSKAYQEKKIKAKYTVFSDKNGLRKIFGIFFLFLLFFFLHDRDPVFKQLLYTYTNFDFMLTCVGPVAKNEHCLASFLLVHYFEARKIMPKKYFLLLKKKGEKKEELPIIMRCNCWYWTLEPTELQWHAIAHATATHMKYGS